MSTAQAPTLNMDKLNAFIGQFVTDLGASVHAGMVVIGEKLGLYKALATGPMSTRELAAKTGTDERYLHEWLASQAAGGYITYDDATNKFSLIKNRRSPSLTKTVRLICPALSNSLWVLWPRCRALPSRSAPEPEWAGTSTTTESFMVARSFFGRAMRQILSSTWIPAPRT